MNDAQMREPLFDYLEAFYGKIRILEEKNTGASRADVIGVIDGALLGFEIKSDVDSYLRLATQTKDYDQFCDFNYLVRGTTHLKHAHEHIPGHWGILVIREDEDGSVTVEMDQLPARNEKVQLKNQLGFLWRPELEELLARNELPAYRYKSKLFVQEKLLEKVPEDKLRREITDILFERNYNELLEKIAQVRAERAMKKGKVSGTRRRRGRARRKRS